MYAGWTRRVLCSHPMTGQESGVTGGTIFVPEEDAMQIVTQARVRREWSLGWLQAQVSNLEMELASASLWRMLIKVPKICQLRPSHLWSCRAPTPAPRN